MTPSELQHVLATAPRLTAQIPANQLDDKLPNRNRSLLALANHIVEIAAGYLLVEAGRAIDREVAGAIPASELDRDALARRSASVEARLAAAEADLRDSVETFFGTISLHRVVERCTWHAAQHVRQLASMLERLGIEADQPLAAADLDGLPLPAAVWFLRTCHLYS